MPNSIALIHPSSYWSVRILVIRLEEDVNTYRSIAVGATTLGGILSKNVIAGTFTTPPPIPKKLDMKPDIGDMADAIRVFT